MYTTNVFESGKLATQQPSSVDETEEYLKRVQQRFDNAKRIMSEASLFQSRY